VTVRIIIQTNGVRHRRDKYDFFDSITRIFPLQNVGQKFQKDSAAVLSISQKLAYP
jgi:hypothetical protein